jgi:hypothetical protein
MNEIILAPCDVGYVQSCTGFGKNFEFFKIIFSKKSFFLLFNVLKHYERLYMGAQWYE